MYLRAAPAAAAVALAALAAAPAPARAGQATCSNPGLPLGAAASSELMPGRLSLSLTSGFLPVHSEEILDDGAGPVLYDTRLALVETRLAAEYAVRPWLAVTGALPYRVIDVDVAHRDPATGAMVPGSSLHSRTETLHGVGDPSLDVHLAREVGALRVHARLGTSLPLGRTEEDPHLLGAIGERHQHIQLGTGTFIPYASLEAQRAIGARATVAAWALAHLSLYESGRGFRPSHRFSGGLTASSGLGLRAWTFGAALEAHGETAERWQGVIYRTEGNAGRLDVLAGGSVAWRPARRHAVVADLKYAVYSHTEGTQLDYAFVGSFGVATELDLARRPSWRGADLDVAVAAPAGSAAELVPVPGRITVFDLWAEWCAPCRELDGRLAELARAHPGRLAVRKLDVVDPDSAAWRRHLAPGRFELPHLKVYGADGRLLFERTAPPEELARAVEALLR
jgi:thiol-disulfide isomerase/thioredoxin